MELTAASWESTIVNSPHIWAVKFFSGMCSSCQAFKPEWEVLAHSVDGLCVASDAEPARASLLDTQLTPLSYRACLGQAGLVAQSAQIN